MTQPTFTHVANSSAADVALSRRGWVIQLAPGAHKEYRRLHREVWPAVTSRILDAGITNYSIFLHGDLLFSYMEFRGDFEDIQAFIEQDEETQRWWQLTQPLQVPIPDAAAGDWWTLMDEVFHVDLTNE